MQFTLLARPPFIFQSVLQCMVRLSRLPFGLDNETGCLSYTLRPSSGRISDLQIRNPAGDPGKPTC